MELLKTREVAEILRVTEKTLMNWRSQKKGPPYVQLSDGMVRYPKEDLYMWLEEVKGLPPHTWED